MIRRPPRSTRTDTRFPNTTLFRSRGGLGIELALPRAAALDHQLDQRRFDLRLAEHADGAALDDGGADVDKTPRSRRRSEEHTSELQSLMRISYAVFCLKKKTINIQNYKSHLYTHYNKTNNKH